MAKSRTPEEGVPLLTKIGRATGMSRGTDIHLPSSGKRDPRLPASAADVRGALGEASKGLTKVREISGRRK